MDIPGHTAPAGSFEVPLEMLSSCHHRIQRQCATLRRLVAHLVAHLAANLEASGPDEDARIAATAVLRYFDTAAQDHHADEEVDLFPALIESMAGSDAVCIRELTAALTLEHRALESHWRRLRLPLQGIAAGTAVPLPSADVEQFITAYEQHIAREDGELLPMAARLLSDEALESIGQAMRLRRGVAAA